MVLQLINGIILVILGICIMMVAMRLRKNP